MFGKSRRDEELLKLQEILLAEEEEEWEEPYREEFLQNEDTGEYVDPEEEEYGDVPSATVTHRYRRGSTKRFSDEDFFVDDIEDEEVIYKKDYKKAKRKKRRQRFGLMVLAILELLGIAAILLWWASWAM